MILLRHIENIICNLDEGNPLNYRGLPLFKKQYVQEVQEVREVIKAQNLV